jgi:hypothetical protein
MPGPHREGITLRITGTGLYPQAPQKDRPGKKWLSPLEVESLKIKQLLKGMKKGGLSNIK